MNPGRLLEMRRRKTQRKIGSDDEGEEKGFKEAILITRNHQDKFFADEKVTNPIQSA